MKIVFEKVQRDLKVLNRVRSLYELVKINGRDKRIPKRIDHRCPGAIANHVKVLEWVNRATEARELYLANPKKTSYLTRFANATEKSWLALSDVSWDWAMTKTPVILRGFVALQHKTAPSIALELDPELVNLVALTQDAFARVLAADTTGDNGYRKITAGQYLKLTWRTYVYLRAAWIKYDQLKGIHPEPWAYAEGSGCYTVSQNGIGIPASNIDIFDDPLAEARKIVARVVPQLDNRGFRNGVEEIACRIFSTHPH